MCHRLLLFGGIKGQWEQKSNEPRNSQPLSTVYLASMTTEQTARALLAAVEKHLESIQYGEEPKELYEPISYLMKLGGKRLRPVLVLLSGGLFQEEVGAMVAPASGVEVFHNFTLMHDDIMDQAPLRRGQPTVHEKWNANVAILSGDVMLVSAYDQMMQVPDVQLRAVLAAFNKVAAEVCEGQQWDMNFETRKRVSLPDYINMIRLKTAVLLGFSCKLGAMLGGASAQDVEALDKFGTTIGLGFQLMDDILDVYADAAAFGKQVGGDIVANKKTWLLISALEQCELPGNDVHKEALHEALKNKKRPAEEKVAIVKGIYDQLGIREQAEAAMQAYYAEGLALLEGVQTTRPEAKEALRDYALALMGRSK